MSSCFWACWIGSLKSSWLKLNRGKTDWILVGRWKTFEELATSVLYSSIEDICPLNVKPGCCNIGLLLEIWAFLDAQTTMAAQNIHLLLLVDRRIPLPNRLRSGHRDTYICDFWAGLLQLIISGMTSQTLKNHQIAQNTADRCLATQVTVNKSPSCSFLYTDSH